MRTQTLRTTSVAIMLLFGAVALLLWIRSPKGINSIECEDRELQKLIAPDGVREGIVVERNCGATTDYSTVVLARTQQSERNNSDEDMLVAFGGRCKVNLQWKASALEIRYDSRCSKFTKRNKHNVVYTTVPDDLSQSPLR